MIRGIHTQYLRKRGSGTVKSVRFLTRVVVDEVPDDWSDDIVRDVIQGYTNGSFLFNIKEMSFVGEVDGKETIVEQP